VVLITINKELFLLMGASEPNQEKKSTSEN
jgi:hypothetical protein